MKGGKLKETRTEAAPARAMMLRAALLVAFVFAVNESRAADERPTQRPTLAGKVVCGYQGWFRCEGDGADNGWHHYAVGGKLEPGHVHVEMWPDVAELPASDRFPTAFRHADGRTAELFSSVRAATVAMHFQWMRDYGIDGVLLQRFAVTTRDPRFREPMDKVLDHCRRSANATGRGWALMYDLSGVRPGGAGAVIDDWKRLVRERRVSRDANDAAYFQHRGKPLVALWGLGFQDRPPMLDEWRTLVDFFRDDPEFGGCAVMLGVPYYWRTLDRDSIADPALHALLAKADIVSPWAVGRLATPHDAAARVDSRLIGDLARCRELGADYLPVIFPGFSWHNLRKSRGQEAKFDAIPRRGGEFLWAQAIAARRAGADMLYVAMFDELDEATAIFKTSTSPPVGASRFLSEPALPSDHYLWLTGQIGRMLRQEIPSAEAPPPRISGAK